MRQQNERMMQLEEQRIERERKQRELDRQRREMEQDERRQAMAADARRCEEIFKLIAKYTESIDEAERNAGTRVSNAMGKTILEIGGACPKTSLASIKELLLNTTKEERDALTLIQKIVDFKRKNIKLYSDNAISDYFNQTLITLTAGNNFSDPDAKIAVAHKLVLEKFKPTKRKPS